MAIKTRFNPMGAGSIYRPNQLIIELKRSGSAEFTIKEGGVFEVAVVGGGGGAGGCRSTHQDVYRVWAGGGSGAGFVGEVYLPAGQYKYSVGGGGSANVLDVKYDRTGGSGGTTQLIKNPGATDQKILISATGGKGGQAKTGTTSISYTSANGGTIDISGLDPSYIKGTPTVNSNGNKGTARMSTSGTSGGTGGGPVWTVDGTKIGAGAGLSPGTGSFTGGSAGGFRLIYKRAG